MKTLRYTAAAVTILMSLMNLPVAFDDGGANLPVALAWFVSLLGVAGIVAAVGLIRNASWGAMAVVAVGVINLAGGIYALVSNQEGAVIGTALSTIITVLGALCVRGLRSRPRFS